MARTINHIERISESFDALDSMSQADIVAELFTRLNEAAKAEALRRVNNHAKMARRNGAEKALIDKILHGTEAHPLMDKAEVEAAGKLALAPVPEVKQ